MHYGVIKHCDIANGEGVRVSLFVSGCTHHCKDCFNPETWSFTYGTPYTEETEAAILAALAPAHIRGLSLLGGEPFEPQNQVVLTELLRKVKESYPQKDIWCYSGYTIEELTGKVPSRAGCAVTDEMLSMIDVLVDGEFVAEKKNISLRFRGSENQRIIRVEDTLATGEIVLWSSANDDVNLKMKPGK